MGRNPLGPQAADDDTPEAALQAESDYWDSVVCGRVTSSRDLDLAFGATIDRLHHLGDVPGPDGEFAARLEARLLDSHPSFITPLGAQKASFPDGDWPVFRLLSDDGWSRSHAARSANGHHPSILPAPPAPEPQAAPFPGHNARSNRWAAPPFATVLLLLMTLSLVAVTLGSSRTLVDRPTGLPAISRLESGTPVLEVPLPPDMMPHDGRAFASLSDYTLAPGSETSWEATDGTCCPGLRLLYLHDGVLILRPVTAAYVVRAGLDLLPTTVQAGQDVTLQTGDAIMVPFEAAFASRNPGSGVARFLEVIVIDGFSPLITAPSGWVWHPDSDLAYGLTFPEQPITLRLELVTLDGGRILGSPPRAIAQLGVTVADNLPIRIEGTNDIENFNQRPVDVYVVTLTPSHDASTR